MIDEAILQKFDEIFPSGMTHSKIIQKLKTLKDDPHYADYVTVPLEDILIRYCEDDSKYPDKLTGYDDDWRKLYNDYLMLLPKDKYFYHAVGAFFRGDRRLFEDTIKRYLGNNFPKNGEKKMTEIDLGAWFLVVFKNAYPMFWSALGEELKSYNVKEGIPELCKLLEDFYKIDSAEDAVPFLLDFFSSHQSLNLPRELLACAYFDLKMWGNALSYLEQVQDESAFLYPYSVYFMMAYCSGKMRNIKDEEAYYRKSLEIFPDQGLARNNLGYCLYKQRRYAEAKKELEESLKLDGDLRLPTNNYVRVLLAMGLNEDAQKFAKSSTVKISKFFLDKITATDGKNHTYLRHPADHPHRDALRHHCASETRGADRHGVSSEIQRSGNSMAEVPQQRLVHHALDRFRLCPIQTRG